VPAVRLVPGRNVLAQRDPGVVLDRYLVVVVQQDQVAQPVVAGQGADLVADALLDVAVRGEAVDVVVEQRGARLGVRVEQAALAAAGDGHADGVAEALPERAGGGLDAGRVPVLRVTRCLRAPLPQRAQVVQVQAVAGEVELDVERQAGVPAGQDKAVAAGPQRLGRIVPQDALEQQVSRRSEAHRRTGMAVAGALHGVHGQHADRVDRAAVQVGPGQGGFVGVVGSHSGCAPRRTSSAD
jgi:hypothetical protein